MCSIDHEINQDEFKITNKVLEEIYKQSDEEMSTALVPAMLWQLLNSKSNDSTNK